MCLCTDCDLLCGIVCVGFVCVFDDCACALHTCVCDVLCDAARVMCVFVFCGMIVCGCLWFWHALCAVRDVLCDDVCVVLYLL